MKTICQEPTKYCLFSPAIYTQNDRRKYSYNKKKSIIVFRTKNQVKKNTHISRLSTIEFDVYNLTINFKDKTGKEGHTILDNSYVKWKTNIWLTCSSSFLIFFKYWWKTNGNANIKITFVNLAKPNEHWPNVLFNIWVLFNITSNKCVMKYKPGGVVILGSHFK